MLKLNSKFREINEISRRGEQFDQNIIPQSLVEEFNDNLTKIKRNNGSISIKKYKTKVKPMINMKKFYKPVKVDETLRRIENFIPEFLINKLASIK